MSSDNFISHDLAVMDKGSISNFANHMNEIAKSIGALNSNFVNPHGYHHENHYSTPYDMSQIARASFNNNEIIKIAGSNSYEFEIINKNIILPLKHTSSLLNQDSEFYNPNVIACKTGYHTPAGRTLVAKAVYDDIELIGVVMRTDSPNQFIDMNNLFEYGSKFFKETNNSTSNISISNKTYSPWAESTINTALKNGWITNSSIDYTSNISTNTFLNILRNSVSDTYYAYLTPYSPSSIYKENLPTTREYIAKICYDFLSNMDIYIPPITTTINDIQDSPYKHNIEFCVSIGLISLDQNNNFNPYEPVSYESALTIISKLHGITSRYDSYNLPTLKLN